MSASVLVASAWEADARADAVAAGLRACGHRVALIPGVAALFVRGAPDCVVTTGGSEAHLAGLVLRRRGAAWILDARDGEDVHPRLVRSADGVACSSGAAVAALHARVGGSLLHAPDDDLEELAAYAEALVARRGEGAALRAIMLGPVNSPHVEHMAMAVHRRGVNLQVAGEVWPGLPTSALPAAGIPVSCVSKPFPGWFRRLLREHRPHVTHAHWTPFAVKARLSGARPLVVTPWGSDVYRAEGVFKTANTWLARWAEMVATDSQDLLDAMIALGTPPERTMLLNWGVDLERFTPAADRAAVRERLGLGAGPVVLSPRLLKSFYNPGAIVAAFRGVRDRFPDARLVLKHMSTDAPDLPELRDLPDGATIVGQVPYEQMVDYYRAADVCVSVPDTDSSPRSVWEAMACGVPCVVSDLPWARELIEPGADALVVPIEPAAIGAAIERVLAEPELAATLAQRGRELVERHRSQERETDRLVDLYERVGRPR